MSDDPENNFLAPSKEEQAFLVLQGKCPHNQGYVEIGNQHNDTVYRCCLCKELRFF